MLFGTFDGQMMARYRAYVQKLQDQQKAEQQLRQQTVSAPAGRTMSLGGMWERFGGKPTDTKDTVPDVAKAVKHMQRQVQGRGLIAAIDRLHSQRKSDGKPVVFVPE